jgi:RimJ/RimL family protein N-acetyltransferase
MKKEKSRNGLIIDNSNNNINMISLQKFSSVDFLRLILWIRTEEYLVQFAGPNFTFPLTEEQLTKHIADPKRKAYKVILNSTMECIGHCEIFIDKTPRLGRILIAKEENRGKGYGKLIVQQLIQICTHELNSSSIDLNVYDWNDRAIKCYKKLGFIINPEISSSVIVNGKTWISLNMQLHR